MRTIFTRLRGEAERGLRTPALLLLLTPNIAFAKGGGGGLLLALIFLPLLIWVFVKIWTFWFRLIFGGREHASAMFASKSAAPAPVDAAPEMKECPHCAEPVRVKAKKCKHCGSAID